MRRLAWLVFLLLMGATEHAQAKEPADDKPRRLSHLLGYVAADYASAVRDGAIIDRFEYEEQLAVLDASMLLAIEAQLPVVASELRELRSNVASRAAVGAVEEHARRLRRSVIGQRHITLTPPGAPNLGRGRTIFATHCAKCHGTTGRADTEEAARLKPRPVSFTDPTVVETLSPLRVADTVRFGIDGTAMVPFSFLDAQQRWDVAFFVVSLRHTPRVSPHTPRLSLAELAIYTDREILDELFEAGAGPRELLTFAAELRTLPQRRAKGSMAHLLAARKHVTMANLNVAWGQRDRARTIATTAHASAIRPAIATIASVAPALANELDERFLAWRARILSDSVEALNRDARVLAGTITRAQLAIARYGAKPLLEDEHGLGGVPHDGPRRATWGQATRLAFAGALRALLWPALAYLLALAVARRHARQSVFVAGAMSAMLGALVAGTATLNGSWLTVVLGFTALALIPAALALVPAALALVPAARVANGLTKHTVAVCVVAASAGFSVGLQTTWLGREGLMRTSNTSVALGLGGALVMLALVSIEGSNLCRRVQQTHRIALLSALSGLLTVVMAGRGVMSLQAAGVVPAHVLGFVGQPLLGVHPTIEAGAAQLMVGGLVMVRASRSVLEARTAAPG